MTIGDIRWLGIPIGRGTETRRNIKLVPVARTMFVPYTPPPPFIIEMRVASLTLIVVSALTAVLATPINDGLIARDALLVREAGPPGWKREALAQPTPPGWKREAEPQPTPPGWKREAEPQPTPPGWKREAAPLPTPPGWKREAAAAPTPPGWKREAAPQPGPPGWKREAAPKPTPPGWK